MSVRPVLRRTLSAAVVSGIVTVIVLAAPAGAADASAWWLTLRTTGYAAQSFDSVGEEIDHFEGYQHLSGALTGLAEGRVSLRLSARFADDLRWDDDALETSRLHAAQILVRPAAGVRLTAGRQFLREGVAAYTLDGLRAEWRPARRWRAVAWAGGRVSYGHRFDLASASDDAARGLRVAWDVTPRVSVDGSLAYRKRDGAVAERPLGLGATAALDGGVRVLGRLAYDAELDVWKRVEAQVRLPESGRRPALVFQALDRRPTVDASSWFARFLDAERVRVLRAVATRTLKPGYGAELECLGTFVDDRNRTRLGLTAVLPWGRVGWSMRSGDLGEENGFHGSAACDLKPWLRVEGYASYLNYALLSNAAEDEDRELTTLAARVQALVRPGCRISAELQRLSTPELDSDVRLLLGVNLSAGGGASPFGLGAKEVRP